MENEEMAALQENEAAQALAALRSEAEALRAELAAERRISAELREFCSLYPETGTEAIPEAVWEQVRGGIPMAAAYALHERRQICTRQAAEAAQASGRARSAGEAGSGMTEMPYTPEEVRAMSREEVRRNYGAIVASMKHW